MSPASVPYVVTNLLFVLASLLVAFVCSAAAVLEVATGTDDVSTLYLLTQVTSADHFRKYGSNCFCSHTDPLKRSMCAKDAQESPSLKLIKFGFSINIRRRYGLLALADMFFTKRGDSTGVVANKVFLQLHNSVGSTFCVESLVLKTVKRKFSLIE